VKVISAKHHFAYSKVLPMVFVIASFVMAIVLNRGRGIMEDPVYFSIFLLFCIVWFFFALGAANSKADEVQDHGSYLLVRKSGRIEKIPLSTIINVSCGNSDADVIPWMQLVLDRPGILGDQIVFIAAGGFIKSKDGRRFYNAIAEDLRKRVDLARRS
jgi:hypothetical protein